MVFLDHRRKMQMISSDFVLDFFIFRASQLTEGKSRTDCALLKAAKLRAELELRIELKICTSSLHSYWVCIRNPARSWPAALLSNVKDCSRSNLRRSQLLPTFFFRKRQNVCIVRQKLFLCWRIEKSNLKKKLWALSKLR